MSAPAISTPRLVRPSGRGLPIRRGALALLAALALLMALPAIWPVDPYRVELDAILQPPSLARPLGADENGRDVLARLLYGARMTLGIGLGGALLSMAIGTALGALSGYRGGALDAALMRVVDFALAFPSLFVILIFAAIFPPSVPQLIVLIGLTGWMPVARLTRGAVRDLVNAPYIEAARAIGAGSGRVLAVHLLPNTGGVLFVTALIQFNRAILAEATISFLGLGIQPPEPTWGSLLIGAQDYLYSAPWLAIAPGLAITLTLLAVYSLGIDRAVGPRAGAVGR